MSRFLRFKQIYCNDQCRSAYFTDIRYGLAAGFDKWTDKLVDERVCLYCGAIVPTNEAKRWSDERIAEQQFRTLEHTT